MTFDDKKPIYRKSSFIFTQQIGELSIWDTKNIDARQKIMADLAVKTWSL